MDMFSRQRRSEIMRRITSKDTEPEILVRRMLHRLGYRFRLHRKDLPGKPDIVLPKLQTAVFVHGCFWHGHDCKKGSAARKPKSNTDYWDRKLDRNRQRDARNAEALLALGWKVVLVWACETKNAESLGERLRTAMRATASP